MLQVLEWPNALSDRVPKYPSDAECPWGILRVPLACPCSAQFSFKYFWVKEVCNTSRNGLVNRFIEFFKNFSEYIFYITIIVLSFHGNMMYKLCHVLLATVVDKAYETKSSFHVK